MSLCQFSPARRTPIGRPSSVTFGDHDDLRTTGHAPTFAEDIELDLAEAAGEGNLLKRRNTLVAEKDHPVIVVGPLDRTERVVVHGLGQIDTADLGAKRGTPRDDLNSH
jgi:hypothetical protein